MYLWPGERMRDFFRAHIKRETSLDPAAADKLAEALTVRVNRMLVWDEPPSTQNPLVPQPEAVAAPQTVPSAAKAATSATFDPYAFSVMVVLSKTGRDGLMKRLAEIKTAENLKALIEAQHLAVDRALKKPDELRKAIVSASEQRLADRKAAAS